MNRQNHKLYTLRAISSYPESSPSVWGKTPCQTPVAHLVGVLHSEVERSLHCLAVGSAHLKTRPPAGAGVDHLCWTQDSLTEKRMRGRRQEHKGCASKGSLLEGIRSRLTSGLMRFLPSSHSGAKRGPSAGSLISFAKHPRDLMTASMGRAWQDDRRSMSGSQHQGDMTRSKLDFQGGGLEVPCQTNVGIPPQPPQSTHDNCSSTRLMPTEQFPVSCF